MSLRFAARPALAVAFCVSCTPLIGQCTQLIPASGIPGVDTPASLGVVTSVVSWDPDGGGPQPEGLVVAGRFTVAGSVAVTNVAFFDFTTGAWSPMGTELTSQFGVVSALVVAPNNMLIAGGNFTIASGGSANCVAWWTGQAWVPLGTGMSNSTIGPTVNALAITPSGSVVAGGYFDSADGQPASNIAEWNGVSWQPIGAGRPKIVSALLVTTGGAVIAGGESATSGTLGHVAAWDGSTWTSLTAGIFGTAGAVWSLTEMPNGDIVAGGVFISGGAGLTYVAQWNGFFWTPIGTGLAIPPGSGTYAAPEVRKVHALPTGELLASGRFSTIGAVQADNIAMYRNGQWIAPTPSVGLAGAWWNVRVRALHVLANGDLIAGGLFDWAGDVPVANLARFDGTDWFSFGQGTNARIRCMANAPNGDFVVGGDFRTMEGVPALRIARLTGTGWSALGTGANNSINALAFLPNGDLVAAGTFTEVDGVHLTGIASWNGTAWSTLGGGLAGMSPVNTIANALVRMPNGDLIVGGSFTHAGGVAAANIARWDGTTWSPIGSGLPGNVFALAVAANGDLLAGGAANMVNVKRWNGTTWSSLGAGIGYQGYGSASAIQVMPNGDIVVGGYFQSASGVTARGIARWDGVTWSAMGTEMDGGVSALALLPNGELVAGPMYATAIKPVSRWNGSTWTPMAAPDSTVAALLVRPNDELAVGGSFHRMGNDQSAYFARFAFTCVPVATANANGCASSGGANVLSATSAPWVGTSFRARGTGLPNLAIVLALTGFTSIPPGTAPLSSFFAQSPAGCDLLVGPDIVETMVTTNGVADSRLFVPNTPSILGIPFFHQMVPVEVDAGLSILAITATNSLRLVAGDL